MFQKLNGVLNGLDAVLLTSAHGMRYFSGFSGGEGYAFICKTGRYLLVDSRYTEIARREAGEFQVIEFGGGDLYQKCNDILAAEQVKLLGYEDAEMTCGMRAALQKQLPSVEFVPASEELERLRMVKTVQELECMRRAEQIGVNAFQRVLDHIKPGVSENEIAAELEYEMRKQGAAGTSFETIVISGEKTCLPHGKPDDTRIQTGDFITMDFGCVYQGYCSDMTRTVVVGRASEEQRKVYETVRRAQETGLSRIRAGISGKMADRAARQVIEDAGYGQYFGHSLGHGVGLLIHELPNLSPRSEIILEENMVVTCEPGIYIPGFGGVRIEDMVCVKKDGIENLTHLSKELIEL